MYVGLAGFKNSVRPVRDLRRRRRQRKSRRCFAADGGDGRHRQRPTWVATRRSRSRLRRSTRPTRLFRAPPRLIAGIPSDKSLVGTGIDGFTVAEFNGSSTNLLQNSLRLGHHAASAARLAFNPSATNPELEFSISNLSKSGINPTQGFWIEMYAGSGQDVVAGEAGLVWTYVPPFEPQQIPEPATWIVWAGLAGGLAWRRIRSRRMSA